MIDKQGRTDFAYEKYVTRKKLDELSDRMNKVYFSFKVLQELKVAFKKERDQIAQILKDHEQQIWILREKLNAKNTRPNPRSDGSDGPQEVPCGDCG